MNERPDVFAIQDSRTGKIGIAWTPDKEVGGCRVISWISDEMVQIAADHLALARLKDPKPPTKEISDE